MTDKIREQVWNLIFCLVPLIQTSHFPNTVEATPSMTAWHCCHLRPPHKNAEGKMIIRIERCLYLAHVCSSVISQATGLTAALLPRASVFTLPAHWVLLTALRMCLHHKYTSWFRSRFCGIMFKAHLCLGTFHRTIPQTAATSGGPEGINPKLPPSTPWYPSAIASVQNTVTKHVCPTCFPGVHTGSALDQQHWTLKPSLTNTHGFISMREETRVAHAIMNCVYLRY